MVRRRRRWRVWQRHMRAAAFVFLDETGATTAMISRYGWGPRSGRLVDLGFADMIAPRRVVSGSL